MISKNNCRTLANQSIEKYVNHCACEDIDEVIQALGESLIITFAIFKESAKRNPELANEILNQFIDSTKQPHHAVTIIRDTTASSMQAH
ncbi:hypothetical protein [Spartinivicinus ruber]|uniref:hypothetical protein n=1 Tax=Spartinivicinus ruber TaxID=2683272 RepID=UPI0013D314EF|nr:hypothetical protein [Spartinivicinus ruber]